MIHKNLSSKRTRKALFLENLSSRGMYYDIKGDGLWCTCSDTKLGKSVNILFTVHKFIWNIILEPADSISEGDSHNDTFKRTHPLKDRFFVLLNICCQVLKTFSLQYQGFGGWIIFCHTWKCFFSTFDFYGSEHEILFSLQFMCTNLLKQTNCVSHLSWNHLPFNTIDTKLFQTQLYITF